MRLLLFYLLLIALQGFLSALFGPVPAPDLFLLAVLTLLWRLPPWQLVLVAYGGGLLQDAVGNGVLGFHAIGLAGAALAASSLRAQLSQSGSLERLLVVVAGLAGKWLVLATLLAWLAGSPQALGDLLAVAAMETVLTLLAALVVIPWGDALLERTAVLRKELL